MCSYLTLLDDMAHLFYDNNNLVLYRRPTFALKRNHFCIFFGKIVSFKWWALSSYLKPHKNVFQCAGMTDNAIACHLIFMALKYLQVDSFCLSVASFRTNDMKTFALWLIIESSGGWVDENGRFLQSAGV